MSTSKLDTGSLENAAYTELYNAIISGIFPPGSQIVEDQVATQLEMSRTPVRSALKRLQAEGFIEKRANKRIYVTHATADHIIHILHIREALDGMASRLAAINRTDEDIARIQDNLRQSEELLASGDFFKQHILAVQIHEIIYDTSHNEPLARLAKNTETQTNMFTYQSMIDDFSRAKKALEEHRLICEHIIRQDPESAEAAARMHIQALIQRVVIVEKRQKTSLSFPSRLV